MKDETIRVYRKAIENRCSRRSYSDQPLKISTSLHLKQLVQEYNAQSGLSIQLIEDNPEAFEGLDASYGMFKGVRHYFALIGEQNDPLLEEKAGYWGERLTLDATECGLGTCWVAGTYKRSLCESMLGLPETQHLVCVITVGYVSEQKSFKEALLYKLVRRQTKPEDELYTASCEPSEQFLDGIRAVQKAPSARNRQPVLFALEDGIVAASVSGASPDYQRIDLGIAMFHFEIGAGCEGAFFPDDGCWKLAWTQE